MLGSKVIICHVFTNYCMLAPSSGLLSPQTRRQRFSAVMFDGTHASVVFPGNGEVARYTFDPF